ncbi:hypothetical protein CONLIGDRAFT_204199 [Coniochaeta ligniaria NRRL 30616]|uniref:USP domain-containing protein n=1 Tax=Coniochaeta ligniaria NRRL 30616 TaxID=1408157 RepID=A0A1J7J1R0_9PEZI|nr:hypothetical protein CONLIGDRAFT_204199 [Coniochaeta ligniaria NRRL 30616]
MDPQAANSVESRERAVSSEPCSTRPNPFDDGDTSSRKRRRTSLSGVSRSRSVDSVTSSQGEQPTSDDLSLGTDSATMKDDTDPVTPQTPERKPAASQPTPRSSRVTINVRTPSRPLETIPSSPPISEKELEQDPIADMQMDDDVKISVEETEVDMTNADTPDRHQASSGSETSSPPVEVVTIDDDPEYESAQPQVTLLHAVQDPTIDFPFRDTAETLAETVSRLTSFMSAHESVAKSVSDWIQSYLAFAKSTDHYTIWDSYRENRELWHSIPELVNYMLVRRDKHTYPRNRGLRRDIFQFYGSFAMLTAFFIDFDIRTMRHTLPMDHSRMPDLVSPSYIHALGTLSRREEILFQQAQAQSLETDFSYVDEMTEVMAVFQTFHSNQGGSMAYLAKFAQMLSELISRYPKLCEYLGYISCLMANLTRESSEVIKNATRYSIQEVEQCKGNIARAYQYFETMSATMSTIIDKHVNYLSQECATHQIVALTEIYQTCLSTDRIVSADVIQEHRKTHLPIANHSVPEAMAYNWRFITYTRLIMSSQMQLRVMAASSMCNDLVSFWRRYNGHSDEANAFLSYLADFLLRTGLVAYILGPTCHPEITVESSNIVGFLLVSETYTNEHTDLLWQTITSTQDPRVSEALIRMTCRITNLYPVESLIYLCQKLNLLAVEAFSPNIREFCSQILGVLRQKVADGPPLDISPYLLCLRLARQSSVFGSRSPVAYPDLLDFSTQHFKDLLNIGPDADGRRRIFLECLRDIGCKSSTSLGSLAVMSHLFTMRSLQREMQQLLASEHDFARLLIDEMEAAIPAGREAGFPAVISGAHNAPRKDMIMVIVYSDTSSITTDLGHKLWNLLVGSDAACREDRDAGWQILNYRFTRPLGANAFMNAFISTCFTEYLPTLPPECFCPGALDFVRAIVLPLVNDVNSIVLDDNEGNGQAGIEQLWRMILTAPSYTIEHQAIHTLVNDIYVESRSIASFPPYRARKVHLAVADRCLRQLSSSAIKLGQFGDGTASGDDLEPMVIVASEQQVQEQELLFIRSLAVLRELHQLHQAKTQFTVPDLSSLILDSPTEIEGDSAELKYQAFDWNTETDVKPLHIGRQNTIGSLLASLREATGFSNYRIYFRGQQFLPQENDVSKTLEELQVENGLMLVKREPELPASPKPLRPGASPLENEILAHFEELWAFLSMEEKLAKEIYTFLVKLPPDENIIRAIKTVDVPYTELFPIGQPFKSLYAVYALWQYLSSRREQKPSTQLATEWEVVWAGGGSGEYPAALSRGMSLIVAAITDEDVLSQCPSPELRIALGSALVRCFVDIVKDPSLPESASKLLDAPLLERLVTICVSAPPTSNSDNRTEHVCLCLQGIFECCSRSVVFWSAFQNHQAVMNLVKASLLHDQRPSIRQHTASIIRQKATTTDDLGVVTADEFSSFFWPLVSTLIEPAMEHAPGAPELFETCFSILKQLLITKSEALQPGDLFSFLGTRLLAYTTYEDMTRPDIVDHVARGLIQLMHCIVISTDTPINQPKFSRMLFWKLLFPRFETYSRLLPESADHIEMPKPVLCTASRQMLIDIIFKLVDGSPDQMQDLLNDLGDLVPYYGDDGLLLRPIRLRPSLTFVPGEPYAYDLLPQFERAKAIRAPCGYTGMRNLSNTCYLNSLFTQLFMNVSFRKFMLGAQVPDGSSQSLLFQTQKLFAFMQDSLRRSVDPEDCVATIKTYEDGQIDIHNQMDVDEFYNLLFDRWESQLDTPDAKREFRSFYGGQLVQQVRSKECEHISERLEPFSAIQCDIKGKTCLQESLQAYVDGEIMEGDNKYKCSTCDRHVDAVKRACLKDIPDNLIFHLKRFDFNLRTLQRSKINDHFAFPTQIDMRPYTIEHLSDPARDIGEDIFELVGVLVHSGTAESGHYYSYVRERPGCKNSDVWVEFNDDVVTSWDPAQLESACFGGLDYRPPFDGSVVYDKSYSAYMLFYQRASSLQADQELVNHNNLPVPVRAPIPSEMDRYIQRENISLLRRHCIYDPSQMDFVVNALDHLDGFGAANPAQLHKMEDAAINMALGHLDQVASRTKDIPDFERLIKKIEVLVQTRPMCALRVYEYFNMCHQSFRALIQRNPEPAVRSGSSSLLIQAVRQIKSHFPDRYGEASDMEDGYTDRNLVLHGMMRIFRVLFEFFHVSIRAWYEVFGFMVDYLKTGPHELATFLKHPFFKSLLNIIFADPSLDLPQQFARMVANISRRLPTRPPSYENIIELIDMVMSVTSNKTNDRGELIIVDHPERRLDGVDVRGPFPLWKQEYRALIQDWAGRNAPNIFLEKLIAINQNESVTCSVISHYMRLGRLFEEKVYRTLKGMITGAVNNPPASHLNAPFLNVAAMVYCPEARNTANVQSLIDRVTDQCQTLENAEGLAFFEFQRDVFDKPRGSSGEIVDDIVVQRLRSLPDWAPYLLGYFDPTVGREVEEFLHDKLFALETSDFVESDEVRLAQARLKCARILGCRCLSHLKEQYVSARANAPAQLVARFERVINNCSKFFNLDEEGEDRTTTEFFRLCRCKSSPERELSSGHGANLSIAVLEPLRRLAVDDMEEDGSGMFYSDSSSVTSSVTAG